MARRALAGVVLAGIVLAGCTAASPRAESLDMEVRGDFERVWVGRRGARMAGDAGRWGRVRLREPPDLRRGRHRGATLHNRHRGAACDAARRDITARIEAINAKFASWRPMTRVPVQDPWRIDGGPALPQPTADLHRRPVEALYHGGHFIARVPGVKVLQSIPMPWRGGEPTQTMGASDPTIMALYVDPPTGFAVAELSIESASCMSDPTSITRPVAVAPEVLTEAAARAAFVLSEPVDG